MRIEEELADMLEEKINHTIRGVSETLNILLSQNKVTVDEIVYLVSSLQPSFRILSKKWVLEILYVLLISGSLNFSQLKRIIKINQSSLSLKLRELEELKYIERKEISRKNIKYSLTERGKNIALLSIPLLYYISREEML